MTRKFFAFVASALAAVMMFSCEEPIAELELNPQSLTFASAAESKTVTFSSAIEWNAEITQGAEWITLSEMGGTGYNGELTVSVTANTTSSTRTGRVVFKSGDLAAELLVEQSATANVPTGLVIPEPIYRPDVVTPIDYVADLAEGGMDGVTIEITGKETNNIKFQVRPGANIQSYRLDVYPLCRLYNSLYESARQGGMDMSKQLTKAQVESMIRGFIFDSAGAGAYTFSNDTMEDYLDHEFDWMNTAYAQAKIVPDCEYVIAAVGCFDADGNDQGDMTLCYVRTPYKPLIGNPAVGMDIITSYTAMQVTYIPNDDCKYFYQWVSNESDLQPYIDAYGDKMYSDFMRNAVYDPTSREDLDACTYYIDFGLSASSEVPLMATAIGLDKNFTPAPEFQSEVFQLMTRPEETTDAVSSIKIDYDHVAAGLFWLDVELGANCSAAVMKVLPASEIDAIKEMTPEAQATYAEYIYQDGWGFGNTNYLYNRETDELLGSGITMKEVWVTVSPDTEYAVVWTAMNQYKELAPLQFTEVVKTKPIEKNNPAASKEDAVLNLTHSGVQQVHIEFVYDFAKTSKIHFQHIESFGEKVVNEDGSVNWVVRDSEGNIDFIYPTKESPREELLDFLYAHGEVDMGAYSANHWYTEPTGRDKWTDVLDPNTSYTIAYVAEDWNGVLGEVKFASTKTDALQGGENPAATITGQRTGDGTPYFQFDMVQDAMQLYYLASDDPALNFKDLGNKNKLRFKDVLPAWESFCMNYSLKTYAMQTKLNASHGSVALCIPIGGSVDEPIYGELQHLIYAVDDAAPEGEFRDLGFYYPNDYNPSAVSALRQQVISKLQRQQVGMPASELPEATYGTRRVRNGNVSGEGIEIHLDYAKFSSHPKATGR